MTRAQTTTTTTGRAGRGWSGIVSDLTTAPDLPSFLRGMLDLQCKIVAAEYGALWLRGEGNDVRLASAWPGKLEENAQDNPIIKMLSEGARNGFQRQVSHVLKVEHDGAETTPGLGAHVFVTVLRANGAVEAVTTVVADCRDPSVLQSTAPLRELAAGLFEQFHARQLAEHHSRDAQRVRRAMALLATSQEGGGYQGACLNLVNELARQLKCSRVSLGWIKGRGVRVTALSDTEELKRHSQHVARLETAMAECLDQQQPILSPTPPDAEPLLAEAVQHAHRALLAHGNAKHVLSLPMRFKDEWVGVITLERADQTFDNDLIQFLQLVVDVIAPQLYDRHNSDRWLIGHAWESCKKTASYLVGPKHVVWKMVGVLAFTALMLCIFMHWTFRVGADFTFEARSKRVIPAPYEGDLQSVLVNPGQEVKAGQTLAQLNATEYRLQLAESQSRLKLARIEQSKAMNEGKNAEAAQAQASAEQIQARIDLLEYKIRQSTIVSPIDGIVLSGDWHDKVGGVIKQGDPMFEVSPLKDLVAVLRVSETEIDYVQLGQTGKLATRSEPEKKFHFTVTRVVPMAGPVEGKNVFEVRAELDEPAAWLRPGMEGLARVNIDSRPIGWILTHEIVDTIRLWVWW
jgi:multidrug resistance efflux pump/GAF domain-containing protein